MNRHDYVMFAWSLTEEKVSVSEVFGQASMKGCVPL